MVSVNLLRNEPAKCELFARIEGQIRRIPLVKSEACKAMIIIR